VTVPVAIAVCVYAEGILGLFGPRFQVGETVLRLLAVSTLVNISSGPNGFLLKLGGRENWALGDALVELVVAVVGELVLISRFGISGAAMGVLMATSVGTGLRTVQVGREYGVWPWTWRTAGRAGVVATGSLFASFVMRLFGLPWMVGFALSSLVGLGAAWSVVGLRGWPGKPHGVREHDGS